MAEKPLSATADASALTSAPSPRSGLLPTAPSTTSLVPVSHFSQPVGGCCAQPRLCLLPRMISRWALPEGTPTSQFPEALTGVIASLPSPPTPQRIPLSHSEICFHVPPSYTFKNMIAEHITPPLETPQWLPAPFQSGLLTGPAWRLGWVRPRCGVLSVHGGCLATSLVSATRCQYPLPPPHTPLPKCDSQKCHETLPNVPRGQVAPCGEPLSSCELLTCGDKLRGHSWVMCLSRCHLNHVDGGATG